MLSFPEALSNVPDFISAFLILQDEAQCSTTYVIDNIPFMEIVNILTVSLQSETSILVWEMGA